MIALNTKSIQYVIDRIEGDFAVVELPDEDFCLVPLAALPQGVSDGDIVQVQIIVNETKKKQDDLFARLTALTKKE